MSLMDVPLRKILNESVHYRTLPRWENKVSNSAVNRYLTQFIISISISISIWFIYIEQKGSLLIQMFKSKT